MAETLEGLIGQLCLLIALWISRVNGTTSVFMSLRQLAQRVEAHEHSGEHDVAQHDLQVLEGSGDRDGILLRALVGFGLPGSTAGRRTYRPGRPVPWCVGGLIAFSTRSTGVVIRQCIRVMRRVIFRESGSSDFFRFQACATVNKLLTMAHSGAAVPSGSLGRKLHVRQVSAWRSTNRVRSPSKSLNSASSCGVIWLGSLRHHGSERLPWPFPRSRSLCVLSCEPWLCWTSCCGGFWLVSEVPLPSAFANFGLVPWGESGALAVALLSGGEKSISPLPISLAGA